MRPMQLLVRALPVITYAATVACGNMTGYTGTGGGGGGGGGGTPVNVQIVQGAQTLGHGAFEPDTFTVSLAAGGKVKWANRDLSMVYGGQGVTHHIVSDDGTTFISPNIAPGNSYTATFTAEGTFAYHCTIHPGMLGAIVVAP